MLRIVKRIGKTVLRRHSVIACAFLGYLMLVIYRGKREHALRNRARNAADSTVEFLMDSVHGVRAAKVIPVLILACNRSEALRKVLEQVLSLVDKHQFPITVSLDCEHEPTQAVARSFNVEFIKQPDQHKITNVTAVYNIEGYHRLSRHYRWALDQMVNVRHRNAATLIILEDDLNLSIDLFRYFAAFSELLEKDKTLLCVSGYNDNGKLSNIDISKPCQLWRSDFFPGLGWMTTAAIVRQLLAEWPAAFWDDWLRDWAHEKGLSCLRPEVSKTTTFGRMGVSSGQFFDAHLSKVLLNHEPCEYGLAEVGAMTAKAFSHKMMKEVRSAQKVSPKALRTLEPGSTVMVICNTKSEWKDIASVLDIMSDIRPGGVRNMYHLVVPTFHRQSRVYVNVSSLQKQFKGDG